MAKGSQGPGWGGPAKGAGSGSAPAKPFGGEAGPGRGHMSVKGMARAERIERWTDMLDEIAISSENDSARVSALNSLLDRTEGKPVQKVESSGPNGGPQVHEIRRTIVDPGRSDTAGLPASAGAGEV